MSCCSGCNNGCNNSCNNSCNNGNNGLAVFGSERQCCYPDNPFIGKYRVCCDCDGECCGCFEANRRDCFWPEFSHPTWLCCEILYSCPAIECPQKERPIDADDKYVDGICDGCDRNRDRHERHGRR